VLLLSDAGLVYFVVFRETLETSVIVSVLLAFVKQALGQADQDPVVYKKLVREVDTLRTIANCFLR
jgi:high-affinity Fe2+/Pb2+ permease